MNNYQAGLSKLFYHQKHLEKMRRGKIVAPIHVSIFPTIKCQLACPYCCCRNEKKDQPELSIEDFTTAINTLNKYGTKAIEFSGGGEPLLWTHFVEGIKQAYSKGFKLSLITNGLALDTIPQMILSRFSWIRVSVYSMEQLRKVNFSHIPKEVPVSLSWIVSEGINIKELHDFAKEKNLKVRIAIPQPATFELEKVGMGITEQYGEPFFFSQKPRGNPAGCYMAWVRAAIDWEGFFLPCPAIMINHGEILGTFRLCHAVDLEQWLRMNRPKDLGFNCKFCNCGKEINDFVHGLINGVNDVEFV
jgi:organic radical activating enzyme